MQPHSKLSYAIAAILGGGAFGPAVAANSADTGSASEQIQEITVTAQRRTENIQDVPIAIQALTGETLSQLNVATFNDFIKYLPNVTAPTSGPGQGQIFMRGLSVGSDGTQSGGSISGFPNVAIYLDDQSGHYPAATSMSTRRTWNGSRFSRGLREPCSAQALKPAPSATSRTSRR